MNWRNVNLPLYLNLLGAVILLAGVSLATWIYVGAESAPGGVLGYEGGYPINPGDSKQYQRELELYGGKANVLADEFRRWFGGLWRGKTFAVTMGAAGILISLALFYAADRVRSAASPEGREGRPREGS